MKYVLIHWTVSNETSILCEEFVRDKSMLENTEKEGMVVFGDSRTKAPKSGWKSYLGRVLATSDGKNELMKKEREFFDSQSAVLSDDDGSTRNRKRQCLEIGRTQNQENNQKKLSPAKAKKVAERKAYNKVLKRIAIESDCDSGPEEEGEDHNNDRVLRNEQDLVTESLNKLEKEVSGLRKEITTLYKKIPELIRDGISSALNETNKENRKGYFSKIVLQKPISSPTISSPKTPSTVPRTPSTVRRTPSTVPRTPSTVPRTPSTSTLPRPPSSTALAFLPNFNSDENTSEKDALKSSRLLDYIDQVQMAEILRSPNHKKMTANLLTSLFERKVLAESSVTGKSKDGRPALDRTKVELIIACVLEQFPDVNQFTVKSTMAQKCKDLRFSMEGRRRKVERNGNADLENTEM